MGRKRKSEKSERKWYQLVIWDCSDLKDPHLAEEIKEWIRRSRTDCTEESAAAKGDT